MGSSQSALLDRLASPESLAAIHPFYNELLSSMDVRHLPRSSESWSKTENRLEETIKRLLVNNAKTGNIGSMVDVVLRRCDELEDAVDADSKLFVWVTTSALCVVRVVLKLALERADNDDNVVANLLAGHANKDDENEVDKASDQGEERHEKLITALIQLLAKLPLTDMTYGLHCECLYTFLLLLSPPLFRSSQPLPQFRCLRITMGQSPSVASLLVTQLLNHVVEMRGVPEIYFDEGGSLVLGLASGMWNIVTLGLASSETPRPALLSQLSMQLLLILGFHCVNPNEMVNPYRQALVSVSDPLLLGKLFKFICGALSTDEATLLLYLQLHCNSAFRTHLLASSDMDELVLPLLQTLYNAPTSNSHHIYMSLIVVLVLTEEELFNRSVHEHALKQVDWYAERRLNQVSLGGLVVLVVIRTVQFNMLRIRDKYLHTNCLAALANMASEFRQLHPYVCQRLVAMFETLAKKYNRLAHANHVALDGSEDGDEDSHVSQDVVVLEEVLRIFLEILNACLVHQTHTNPNLIYSLLYKREVFQPVAKVEAFADLSANITNVISFFSQKLEEASKEKERVLSVDEVQELIRHSAMQYPKEKLKKLPDLKFKYVEEEQPEDFFVPYVWSLSTKLIPWDRSRTELI